MFRKNRSIFREAALERISSPENLDQLMVVVNPKDWLLLVVFGLMLILMAIWTLGGNIPTVVTARGILIQPSRVVDCRTLGSGKITSLTIKPGDNVKKGDVIGRIEQRDLPRRVQEDRTQLAELQLKGRIRIPPTEQAKLVEKLQSRISPNEIEFEKSSDIISEYTGRILDVMASVGQVATTGERIARLQAVEEDSPLISVSYFPVADGNKIRPGMLMHVAPDGVERQRFGSIIGHVVSVSALTMTRSGAAETVGSAEIAASLMPLGPHREVISELEREPSTASGYRWSSSSGPPMKITGGLTHIARVTVESRHPISYVMPFMREITGTN